MKAGGTVDEYTGINPNYLYLVKDTNVWATEDYVDDAMDTLAPVAFSGDYNDLTNKPTIPTVNNGILSIQGNGTTASTFTANQNGNTTLNIKGSGGTTVTKSANNEITISSTDDNYYPTSMSWVGGTTSGPTATISMSGTSNISVSAIPSASESQSGIVTTGTQTFKGNKSFTGDKTELKATETYLGTTVPSVRALSDEPKTLQLLTMSGTTGGMYDTVIFSGAGDYFLGAHLKSDWDIRASYKGSGDNSDTYDANLGYTGSYLNYLTDWKYGNGWSVLPTKVTTNTPAVIQIKRNTRIDYTDVCRLILTGHNLKDPTGNYSGFLDDYTIEVCTDYTNDTWTTVVNRTNASDNIGKGLFYALQTASYTPIFGIRLTITKCHVNGSGYAFIKITSMQLRDYRPSHDLQTSLGCVSILGGDIYGELKINNNLRTHYIYPETTNTYNIGSSSSQYNNLYAKTIYENGTSLVDKYLGKTAKAADSDKLNGQSASYYATASSVPTTYLKSASSSGNTLTLTKQDNTTVTYTPSFTDNDHYPTAFTWTTGTTSGPTGSLSGNSGFTSVSFGAIPSATSLQSGIVTTGNQTFAGNKNFTGEISVLDDNGTPRISTYASSGNGTAIKLYSTDSIYCNFGIHWDDSGILSPGTGPYFTYQHGNSFGDIDFITIPEKSGILALDSTVSQYQSSSVVVGNATTNINGRVFQNYTATLITAGGYTFYQILKNGSNPTEDEAKEYMRYMTGSTFLPTYNYDFPKQTIFTFADRSTWKVQYSSSDGLRLYRLTTPLALASDIPTVNNGTLTIQKNGSNVATFSANQSGNATANITVPTKTSDLTNDSGFVTGPSSATSGAIPLFSGTTGKVITNSSLSYGGAYGTMTLQFGSSGVTNANIAVSNHQLQMDYSTSGIGILRMNTTTRNLGDSTTPWTNLHLSGNLTDGTNTLTIAQIKAKQDALPTTTTAGKVLKSTSTAGVVEWGDVVGPGGGVTDVKIGTTSIVSGGIATIPSADATHSGIVNTSNQTFAGGKTFNGEVITYKHVLVYGDNDGSDANKPSNVTGISDIDTYYYNTGITLFDADTDDVYKISFPAKNGTFALTSDVIANVQTNAEIIYESPNCGTKAETTGRKWLYYNASLKNISNYRGLVFEVLDGENDAVYIYMPVSMWRHTSSSKKMWLNASSASYDRWIVAYYYSDSYVYVSDSKSNVGFRIYGIK